jgi:hypothetical protein
MAGRGAPSFLKRQKEQQRAARAMAKRSAKQARRESRATAKADGDDDIQAEPMDQDAGPDDSTED